MTLSTPPQNTVENGKCPHLKEETVIGQTLEYIGTCKLCKLICFSRAFNNKEFYESCSNLKFLEIEKEAQDGPGLH